jgi:endonuclease/exonuclease/phosphatase family metal-dependent hydrolase
MIPSRLSIVTYNIWNTMRWDVREPALRHFVEVFRPDLLCLQELRQETQACLDQALPDHDRIHDDLPGWTCESNIYWNSRYFEEVAHGVVDVGMLEPDRRFFWVRLSLVGQDRTIFVSTAHFTYQGHPIERETGQSPRIEQTRRTIDALKELVKDGEPAFFMGDLNDPVHPTVLMHAAGYTNCFSALGIPPVPTHPCYPTTNIPLGARTTQQTIDWLYGNAHARPLAAQVPHCYCGDIAPSDHWPVLAVYEV